MEQLTFLAVHAHPDDEASSSGGLYRLLADQGVRTVLVTCTNGECGDGPDGAKPDASHHDGDEVAAIRAVELDNAVKILGISRLIRLGYRDSGMKGWPQNEAPNAFVQVDVDAVARTLAAILDEVDATVVVTYDENGFYGHPDHIMANVITRRALDIATSPQRLYYPVVPKSVLVQFIEGATAKGVFLPAWILDASHHVDDHLVTTTMDVRAFAARKHQAIATHASQIDNADLVTMDEELFALLFGTEYYQRAWSRDVTTGDETDLFGGL